METFDLDVFDTRPMSQKGVAMMLLDPAGNATKVVLMVRGIDCALYDATMRAQIRREAEIGPRKKTEEERNAEFWELHATLIAGWPAGFFRRAGAAFDYSPANAAVLMEEYPYIFEQVRRFANDRAHFLPGPAAG